MIFGESSGTGFKDKPLRFDGTAFQNVDTRFLNQECLIYKHSPDGSTVATAADMLLY